MKINKKLTISFLFIFLLFLLVSFNSSQAFEEENKLGFFNNKPLQELLEKPFYLFGDNKEKAIPFYLKDFVDWDHQMIYDSNYLAEIEDPFFEYKENLSKNSYLELSQCFEEKIHYRKSSTLFLKETKTKDFIKSVSKNIDQEPSSGLLKMNKNGQLGILRKSEKGVQVLTDESYQKIKKSLLKNPKALYIPMATEETNPDISTDDLEKYKIKKLVGKGESDFSGSSQTRIFNIKTAAKKFNGIIIKPNEEFSFTTILGEVDESTGYKEELVIKKNQTVPEFGGGICQLSTTMFRAALNTGLKITERHNHSYPVHYYNPPGTDATVYVPKPDLKIKNTLNDYLLIQTEIDESKKKFYISIYSKANLFEVELVGPEIIERTSEGKLRTSLKQVVRNKQGEEIFQDVFKSFYDNPANYPSPNQIITEKPEDWSGKQWDEYYAKFGVMIEEIKND